MMQQSRGPAQQGRGPARQNRGPAQQGRGPAQQNRGPAQQGRGPAQQDGKTPASKSAAHAPYNFVPFSNLVLACDADDALPGHDRIDPALKTGEIHLTMRAGTPVFVSDGNADQNDQHFFRTPGGRYALPGSTVRGMVRANMQILGFGAMRPGTEFENRRFFFRRVGDSRDSVTRSLKDDYSGRLDVQTMKKPGGGTSSIPKRVRAGYLCYQRNEKAGGEGEYQIIPAEKYYRVSRRHLERAGLDTYYAATVPVDFRPAMGDAVSEIYRAGQSGADGLRKGVLLCPGVSPKEADHKKRTSVPSHRYVFPALEACDADAAIPVSAEDALAYRVDWETRKNDLEGGGPRVNGRQVPYDPAFWALPEKGAPAKPVFYLETDGHIYFGMSLFLRIGYAHTLAEGLPEQHTAAAKSGAPRDLVEAILGWAEPRDSRRSRVFFGDLAAQGSPQEMPPVKVVLGQPRPSWFAGYIVDGKAYHQDGFRLRGQKRYWLLDKAYPAFTGKENVDSTLRPLPVGTTFCGVIRYKNLRPHELGLLLWALRLEEDCWQSVGMGRPYGYGRMRLTIDSLLEYTPQELYAALDAAPQQADADKVEKYIRCYDAFAAQALDIKSKKPKDAPSIRSRSEIADFFFLCSKVWTGQGGKIPDPVRYMSLDLKEYQNLEEILPGTREFRVEEKERKKAAGSQPGAEKDPWATLMAQQAARYGSRDGRKRK